MPSLAGSTPVAINDAVSSTSCEGHTASRDGHTVRDYTSRNSIPQPLEPMGSTSEDSNACAIPVAAIVTSSWGRATWIAQALESSEVLPIGSKGCGIEFL